MRLELEGRWETWALRAALVALFIGLGIDGIIAKSRVEEILSALGIIIGIILMFFEHWSARQK